MSKNTMKREEISKKYLQRLQDPIVIIFIIFWIYSIFILGFYFRTSIITATHFFDDTITKYFWNGDFSIFDIETEETTYGFSADFPRQLSWVFIIAMIIFILVTTLGIILSIFKKNITRYQVFQMIIWILFIIASMIISCAIVFFNWAAGIKTDDISISYGRIIMLNLVISIILVLFVLILSSYVSIYKKSKIGLPVTKNS